MHMLDTKPFDSANANRISINNTSELMNGVYGVSEVEGR